MCEEKRRCLGKIYAFIDKRNVFRKWTLNCFIFPNLQKPEEPSSACPLFIQGSCVGARVHIKDEPNPVFCLFIQGSWAGVQVHSKNKSYVVCSLSFQRSCVGVQINSKKLSLVLFFLYKCWVWVHNKNEPFEIIEFLI